MNGIPPLLNNQQIDPVATLDMVTVTAASTYRATGAMPYAVIDENGGTVIEWDSCIYFDYTNESYVTHVPQEQGAFISDNKVATPYQIRTRGTKAKAGERAQFLADCENRLNELDLYDFVTPDTWHFAVIYVDSRLSFFTTASRH